MLLAGVILILVIFALIGWRKRCNKTCFVAGINDNNDNGSGGNSTAGDYGNKK